MLKEDLNLDYKDFLKQYVTSPICDYTISFSYNNRYYQFDFVGVPKNNDGSTAYDFIAYEGQWDSKYTKEHYKSLKIAISKVKIENLSFEEIYNSPGSELIDIS